jgi:selenocysteine-specific elongation factor
MIVGTAGHIDHGKTTLVRALTGVDTDRLKEEKERGISIELGYAYTPLRNREVLGFIDVPGHERLVHTMVSGACGIDFALLVIAADDGVMPQTREHLGILELLGVSQGAVALTKVDRVDSERVAAAEGEIRRALAGTALRDVAIFPLNATLRDDPGTAALRNFLHETAILMPSRPADGLFRLAVDRVFTLAGHGTVVTGTVFSGRVHTGDRVSIMPAGTTVRVRSIHTQNRSSDSGGAGQRCALNLAGVEKSAISRGDWLAEPDALAPTTRMDVRLRLLENSGVRLESWSPVHIHHGTAHCVAHVVLLESERLSAGESGRAQLVFGVPICAVPGDRFIARDARAAHTVGGGVVLDPCAPARKRRSPQRMGYLDALERMLGGDGISSLLEHAPFGMKMTELVRLTCRSWEHSATPLTAITIDAGGERLVILRSHWQALRERAVTALRDFHAQVPDEPGPDVGRLRRIALPGLPAPLWKALIDELGVERTVLRSGPWLRLPDHLVTLSEDEQALARKLQPLIAAGCFDPPWVRDLAAVVGVPEDRVRQVLRKQVTQGNVYQIVRDLFYDRARIGELAALVTVLAGEHGAVDAARYRDAIHLGRKRTIQILEFFDRVGYTRRVRDSHVLRPDSGLFWKALVPGGATGLQTQEGASAAPW